MANFSKYSYKPSADKKIKDFYDVKTNDFVELALALENSCSTGFITNYLKENLQNVTDIHLVCAVQQIQEKQLDLDEDFYSFILPLIKETMKSMNKEHNETFASIVYFLGLAKMDNSEFWELVQEKLIKENLIRYITLYGLVSIATGVSSVNKGSQELFDVLEYNILQQRQRLSKEKTNEALEAFRFCNKGSQLFFQAMEDKMLDLEKLIEEEKAQYTKRISQITNKLINE